MAARGRRHGRADRVPGPAPLPAARLRLGHGLEALIDHGEFVELRLRVEGLLYSFSARHVVLALPPRVAEAALQFQPVLTPALGEALRATPTWMATAAKAGLGYARPFWREAGLTGNACG